MKSPVDDPRFLAGVDLLRRTGMKEFQIRFDDEQEPIVWIAVASYTMRDGRPASNGKINYHRPGCGMNPLSAILDLLEKSLDGGTCTHCQRVTAFDAEHMSMPMDDVFCWYLFDPETDKFMRGCEASHP